MFHRLSVLAVSALVAFSIGCSKKKGKEETDDVNLTRGVLVTRVQTETLPLQPKAVDRLAIAKAKRYREGVRAARGFRFAGEVAPPTAQAAIQGDVTFTKAEIFGRLFLYGTDLQYSSIGEASMSLLVQSMAVGHVPARFNQVGDRLQLVADQAHLFQSDINHPGRLIHEWPITREDAATITVAIRHASPTLVTVLKDAKAPPARQTWVRSVQFVSQGSYLLLETSVEQDDGTVAEFMESVFPRETLVPAGTTPKILLADADKEPLAKRYGFLGGEKLFLDLPKGRLQTLVASRFATPAPGQYIEWYVTPNVPAIYLPILKSGVEGWNRYSQKMWGRDFMRFNGVLPAGVKIGDPRYNVINWDSVPEAGAAYESQAADPLTGLQSHSLIYLPYAWVKIGENYWKRGGVTQDDDVTPALAKILRRGSLLGEKLKVRCMHDLDLAASLEARTSPEVFARELLKLVVFHEVGHALGMAHNFKGSLSWNPDDAKSPVTTSVMDYNQYQLEGQLFTSETSADGPLAEYDRQVISVLYNDGKDVAATDPVLPACEDEVADDYDGGVDPLCMRYDAGQDPTEQLSRTIALVKDEKAKIAKTHSLAVSLASLASGLGDATAIATEAELNARLSEYAKQISGIIAFYYASGAQSLAYMAKSDVKMLYVAKDDLPAPYDAKAMIARSLDGIRYAVGAADLEESSADVLENLRTEGESWINSTTWYSKLSTSDKDASVTKKLEAAFTVVEVTKALVFTKMRTAVLSEMTFKETAPFVFAIDQTSNFDAEKAVMEILEQAVTDKMSDGEYRPVDERVVAAKSLRSFSPIPGSDAVFTRVAMILGGQLAQVKEAGERAELRAILKALQEDTKSEEAEEEAE